MRAAAASRDMDRITIARVSKPHHEVLRKERRVGGDRDHVARSRGSAPTEGPSGFPASGPAKPPMLSVTTSMPRKLKRLGSPLALITSSFTCGRKRSTTSETSGCPASVTRLLSEPYAPRASARTTPAAFNRMSAGQSGGWSRMPPHSPSGNISAFVLPEATLARPVTRSR